MMDNMKAEARSEAQAYINDTIDEARLSAAKEAKRIVINTIQRTANCENGHRECRYNLPYRECRNQEGG